MTRLKVVPVAPRVWPGRYARIPGGATAFHVRLVDGRWWPVVDWVVEDTIAECPMVASDGAAALAAAVNAGKALLGGERGGSFLINERGQILVPASNVNDYSVAIVGECSGPLQFENSRVGSGVFDLADDSGLSVGDVWDRPYVGVPHQLSRRGELYFWRVDATGGEKILPLAQDSAQIGAFRRLRSYGPVRFVAAYGGFALTKIPVGNGPRQRWEPRYAGRIDFRKWFRKEN